MVPPLHEVRRLAKAVAKAKLITQLLDVAPPSSVETLAFLMTALLTHPDRGRTADR
jgi:hypothetical protein